MAITHVGSDQAVEGPGNTNDMTLTLPTHQADDFAIICAKADEAGTVPNLSVATSGWTQLTQTNETSGRDRVTAVFYKRLTSGSETNPAVSTDFAENRSCVLHVFRGVDTTTAFDATFTQNDGSNTANPTPPSIVTVTDNCAVLLYHNFTHNDHSAGGAPSGYTLGEFVASSSNNHGGGAAAYDLDVGTAGTISPGAWTHTASPTNVAEYTCVTIALRPAAAGTEVSASTDALTLAEQAASITLDVGVNAGTDALVLAENAATITLDVEISAGVDSLSLTENASTITYDVDVLAATDALTLTENASTVSLDIDIQAGVDSLTLTENAASVDLGVNVSAGVDALTLTENAASITYDVNVGAGTDALTLTENAASIANDVEVSAATDALTLTENPATVQLGVNVSAGVDALVLTENAATVTLDVNVGVGTDSLLLTEQAASITYDVEINAGTDALTLTPLAATIDTTGSTVVDANTAALVLTTLAATITLPQQIQGSGGDPSIGPVEEERDDANLLKIIEVFLEKVA